MHPLITYQFSNAELKAMRDKLAVAQRFEIGIEAAKTAKLISTINSILSARNSVR